MSAQPLDPNQPQPDHSAPQGREGRSRSERRDSVVDRRTGLDRRIAAALKLSGDRAKPAEPVDGSADENGTGLERRRGAGRRLSDFTRSAEEGELTPEQFLFVMAIQEFKRANNKSFPTWTDVLEVVRLLGYRKTMPSELKLRSAEDWKEAPDAKANVRPQGWERRAA
jgi:hypothetical protein